MKREFEIKISLVKISQVMVVFSWAILIFSALTKPLPISTIGEMVWRDKIVHFFLFGILAFLIVQILYRKDKDNFKIAAWTSFFVSLFYAWFCESFQRYIPGRFPDNLDLLAGFLGILTFIYLSYKFINSQKPKLLLHICCAGCGAYVTELLKEDFRVFLYYYNPCIYPEEEYERRLLDLKNVSKFCSVKYIIDEYNHKKWLSLIKGHEKDPERGGRCQICIQDRLDRTGWVAKEKKFPYFSTTLSVSPHKDFIAINKTGKNIEEKYGPIFLQENFKKKDGFKKAAILSRSLDLYRQDYCGCEFSIRKNK